MREADKRTCVIHGLRRSNMRGGGILMIAWTIYCVYNRCAECGTYFDNPFSTAVLIHPSKMLLCQSVGEILQRCRPHIDYFSIEISTLDSDCTGSFTLCRTRVNRRLGKHVRPACIQNEKNHVLNLTVLVIGIMSNTWHNLLRSLVACNSEDLHVCCRHQQSYCNDSDNNASRTHWWKNCFLP